MTSNPQLASLQTAIDRAGGLLKFCGQMGVTHQAVGAWRKRGYVPPERALAIESHYGVPRLDLVSPIVRAMYEQPAAEAVGLI